MKSLDESFRFFQSYNPREVIMYNDSSKDQNFFVDYFELYHVPIQYRTKTDNTNNNFFKLVSKISYQEKFLDKIYKKRYNAKPNRVYRFRKE